MTLPLTAKLLSLVSSGGSVRGGATPSATVSPLGLDSRQDSYESFGSAHSFLSDSSSCRTGEPLPLLLAG